MVVLLCSSLSVVFSQSQRGIRELSKSSSDLEGESVEGIGIAQILCLERIGYGDCHFKRVEATT